MQLAVYISQLALHGFKSFANKERLAFGQGVTAVVGPNGCGKTNIVDAVRWVLGEQKTRMLRSARLDDIIFNGSDAKKPLSVCEVSLTVHNNRGMLPVEYDDVEITRRVFRNGESEYMINRTACRLKDIHNLFVDTGMGADAYSVIELKMIEDILSENADDRRRMFEEAAGINKYRHQRRATILKLESTKGDLDRVSDIISEVEKNVHGLQLQMKRYKRHALFIEKLQEKEIKLAALKRGNILKELDPLRNEVGSFTNQRSSKLDQEKGREEILQKLRSAYEEQRTELEKIQTEIDAFSEERQLSSNRILVLSEQERGAAGTIERLGVERTEGERKKEAHHQKIEELEAEKVGLDPIIISVTEEYESLKTLFEKSDLTYSEARKRLDTLASEELEQLKKLNDMRSLRERTAEIVDEKSEHLTSLEKKSEDHESQNSDLKTEQKSLIKEREFSESNVAEKKHNLNEVESQITKLRTEKHETTLEYHRILNRVETLESQLQFYREVVEKGEGYPGGTRYVLSHREEFGAILGTVADLLEVKADYRLGIEAALGPVSRSLVCETKDEALELVSRLSEENLGRVWIIPLDAIPAPTLLEEGIPAGVDAATVVSCDSRLQPLVDFFLKGTPIVKNGEEARECVSAAGISMNVVDLEGNLYAGSGLIMSRESGSETGILGRKEKIESLDREISDLVKKSEVVKLSIDNAGEEIDETEENHNTLSSALRDAMDKLIKIENEINRVEFAIFQNLELQQATTHEIISVRSDLLNFQKSLDNLIPLLKKEEEKLATFRTKMNDAKTVLETAQSDRDTRSLELQDHRVQLVSLESKQENLQFRVKASKEAITEIDHRAVAMKEEIVGFRAQIEEMKSDKSEAEKNNEELSGKLKKTISMKNLKDDTSRDTYRQIEEAERQIREEQREREQQAEEMKRIELKIADHEGELRRIEERILEKYGSKVPKSVEIEGSENDIALEIDRIERSIERIGPINMAVKDEYEEENSRLGFLQRQQTDLLESEEKLLETMTKIDTAARTQFLKTFDRIRDNFKKTFTMFFEGGECDLELKNDEDPLEADISILAKPPGKHTRNLRMLSSGEKALTAISLLFAIYLVKPSPFCILDEVDAPLDDHNIGKFTRVLEKFSDQTQFIIVTHNKLTMEAAKYLYGVTMVQSGVSKIVSVQLD
ncbi:MAG: chromosome segregation protein SMC [Candidatus Neomarinimicrobiota bacterium]|nr:chromosome segregation protein SMC [Candidatus Neomarinimicrobiota bacterium]